MYTSGISREMGVLKFGTTAYVYSPAGQRTVFAKTRGSCTQDGVDVTNDYVAIAGVWFNPAANSVFAMTAHIIQKFTTDSPGFCDGIGFGVQKSWYVTQALIKIK